MMILPLGASPRYRAGHKTGTGDPWVRNAWAVRIYIGSGPKSETWERNHTAQDSTAIAQCGGDGCIGGKYRTMSCPVISFFHIDGVVSVILITTKLNLFERFVMRGIGESAVRRR